MDEKIPALNPKEVIKALRKADFYVHHQTGSHLVMRHKTEGVLRAYPKNPKRAHRYWSFPNFGMAS